jgi:hypothetical protein
MDDQRIEEIAGTCDAEDLVRYCPCSDPENCTVKVPGYVCRKTSYAHRFGLLQPRLDEIAREAAKRTGRQAVWTDRAETIKAAIREALSAQEEELREVRKERDALNAQIRSVGIVPYLDRMKELAEARDSLRLELYASEHNRIAGNAELIRRAESAEAELHRLREENVRLRSLQAKACSCICHEDGVAAIVKFYTDVNARAEAEILNGKPVTGAHHRALEAEITAYGK